jgi:hypothetical protein
MGRIKAVVLTYDKYRTLTDHMIVKYREVWPDHPFQFRVPYQELSETMEGVEYIKTPPDIKETVLTLLRDLSDEELIYWCIDDKYPVELNLPRIEQMYQWLRQQEPSSISGMLFCRCRKMLDNNYLMGDGITDDMGNHYLERNTYEQIWIHQFVRVKVIRELFEAFPDVIPYAGIMDKFKRQIKKPSSHRIYVTKENLAVFGESTSEGIVTKNCYKSILDNGLSLPEWYSEITDKEILMGKLIEKKPFYKRLFNRLYGAR